MYTYKLIENKGGLNKVVFHAGFLIKLFIGYPLITLTILLSFSMNHHPSHFTGHVHRPGVEESFKVLFTISLYF